MISDYSLGGSDEGVIDGEREHCISKHRSAVLLLGVCDLGDGRQHAWVKQGERGEGLEWAQTMVQKRTREFLDALPHQGSGFRYILG